eukprot:scaffold42639_cov37-Attheya_sp.AAC.3
MSPTSVIHATPSYSICYEIEISDGVLWCIRSSTSVREMTMPPPPRDLHAGKNEWSSMYKRTLSVQDHT